MNPHIAGNHDRLIDQLLRRIGSAIPPEGLEERIAARLARERSKVQAVPRRFLFFGIPRVAFGAAAATIACFGIVIGSVRHSHNIQVQLPGVPPHSVSGGMGAAGVARPADRPVSPSPSERPRSVRRPEGRAVISRPAQKAPGVAVPKVPAVQQ